MDISEALLAKAIGSLASPQVVHCIECGAPIVLKGRAKRYCSRVCRQKLKLVHYGRGAVAEGRYEQDPTIEDAIQMRMAQALGGGYHEVERRVPPALRAQILERDGGKCVRCGAPATQIVHIAGDANTYENLRAVCGPCYLGMAQERLIPAPPEDVDVVIQFLDRIFDTAPRFPRDDITSWPATYARLVDERRGLLRAHLAAAKLAAATSFASC